MSRCLVALTFVLSSLLLVPMEALTQEATPDASPMASGPPLDLPELMLTPADLEAVGWPGYGTSASNLLIGPQAVADSFVGGLTSDEELARVTEELRAAGIQHFYGTWLRLVDPETGETTREIVSSIDEYTDAAGAEAGFQIIETASMAVDPTAKEVAGSRTIGEKSMLVRYGEAPVAGTPAASPVSEEGLEPVTLDLEFRLGALNARVSIIDYTGQAPEVADVEALADVLLAKIEAEREQEAPGLSFHALRLDPAVLSFDGYVRRDGVTFPHAGESEEERRARETLFGSSFDVYRIVEFVAAGDDASYDDDVMVHNLVLRFADKTAASEFIAELPALLEASPDYEDVSVRAAGLDLGDESVATAYAYVVPDGEPYHDERVTVRDGAVVTTTIARTVGSAPPVEAVDALAAAAAACLASEGWCPLAPIPAGLVPRATPVP